MLYRKKYRVQCGLRGYFDHLEDYFLYKLLTPRNRNQANETVVIKSVKGHPRVANERDVLRRFQHRTPYLRPLIDEIEEENLPSTIALKYLEDDLLHANIKKKMNRKELKYVSKRILEALKVLHDDNYVHTGDLLLVGPS